MSAAAQNFGRGEVVVAQTRPAYQAYQILHFGFTVAPIVAGLDKFFHLLGNWDQYLAPWMANLSPIGGHNMMLVVGLIEAAAGVLVAFRPRIGAPVVGAWLCLIVLSLASTMSYLDVALRDFGLALGAFALWRLAEEFAN